MFNLLSYSLFTVEGPDKVNYFLQSMHVYVRVGICLFDVYTFPNRLDQIWLIVEELFRDILDYYWRTIHRRGMTLLHSIELRTSYLYACLLQYLKYKIFLLKKLNFKNFLNKTKICILTLKSRQLSSIITILPNIKTPWTTPDRPASYFINFLSKIF